MNSIWAKPGLNLGLNPHPNGWRQTRHITTTMSAVAITEFDTAAGTAAAVHQERVTRRMKFPVLWLYREGLNARACAPPPALKRRINQAARHRHESMSAWIQEACLQLLSGEWPDVRFWTY